MKIEIYERASGKVVEALDFDDMKSFRFYWQHQCNGADYGWREPGVELKPLQRRVLKEPDGHHCVDPTKSEFLLLTDELCAQIAKFNGYLSAGEVHHALMQGKVIYTSFSRYRLEA